MSDTDRTARDLTDAITRLRRALRHSIRSEYSWERRPMAQVEVLASLAENAPVRATELASRLRLAQSTTSELLARLLADGVVARGPDSTDRRATLVWISDAGRHELHAWDQAHTRRILTALEALDSDERAAIVDALPALNHMIDVLRRD